MVPIKKQFIFVFTAYGRIEESWNEIPKQIGHSTTIKAIFQEKIQNKI